MASTAPHSPDDSSSKNSDKLNISTLPSACHTRTEDNRESSVKLESSFKPPVSEIVIQAFAPSVAATAPALTQRTQRYSSSSGGQPHSSASSAGPTSTRTSTLTQKVSGGSFGHSSLMVGGPPSFRLQPRNPVKCTPSPARPMCTRGTKRRAHSMSTTAKEKTCGCGSADCSVATEATFHESSLDPSTPRPPFVELAAAAFQGLSLQSPDQHSSRPTGFGESEGGSPVSLFGSQASLARSCFTKYNATSPAGSVSRTNPSSPVRSSCSPRIAPLTVLALNSQPGSAPVPLVTEANGVSGASASLAHSKRPPLYGGMASYMHSLDDSVSKKSGEQPAGGGPVTPPRCPRHPPLSTVHCHQSGATPESALSHDDGTQFVALDEGEVAAASLPHLETPKKKKHSRSEMLMDSSPGGRNSITSMSPSSLPLPRLTLTPRSSSSRPRELFLSMPSSPPDHGLPLAAAATSSAAARTAVPQALSAEIPPQLPRHHQPQRRMNSYIPLPDWGEPQAREEAPAISNGYCAHASSSLLAPPSPSDEIERFLAAHQPSGTIGVGHGDGDSLSASDDDVDKAFFLATPLAIQEEKLASMQQVKHRKLASMASDAALFSVDHHFQSKCSFSSSFAASNTSLRGMNFVTSSTSLDKEGGKVVASSSANLHPSSMHREESQVGLMLEQVPNGPSCDEGNQAFTSSAAMRDLVTPPVMSQPKSPPPFSNSQMDGGIGLLPPRSCGIHYHNASSPPWQCSGEAESPLHFFTQVIVTSTDPDGSPRAG